MKAKAYGKILVFGAYSILEPGNIGLVVNVDKGVTAEAHESEEMRIEVPSGMSDKFVRAAVKYSYEIIEDRKNLSIRTISDKEMGINEKTGLGSSAAATVAVVAAILKMHGIEDRDKVYGIARKAHFEAQGRKGSGYDISAACFGSQYFTSDSREEFEWPSQLISVIIYTGQPASTTELIDKVMEYKKDNPEEYKLFMEEYNNINLLCKKAFDNNDIEQVKFYLEKSWMARKKLGELSGADIEPEGFTKLIEELKANGAYTAGLVGAGGGDVVLALCLKDKEELIEYCKENETVVISANVINKEYE